MANPKIFKLKSSRAPIWMMRQAGRYHSHYQALRKKHPFMELCKRPELACEVTLGPIQDFGFDAAILFSDLLFPLEQLGLGLDYDQGPPNIHRPLGPHHALNREALEQLDPHFFDFQQQACHLLRQQLPAEKTLLGFVGAPWTLFTYAVDQISPVPGLDAKLALRDGRWEQLRDSLILSIFQSMAAQAQDCDALCLFDTSAGDLSLTDYQQFALPAFNQLLDQFKTYFPNVPLIYYGKHIGLEYFESLPLKQLSAIGVDWRCSMEKIQRALPDHLMIQGNIDPAWLHLPQQELKKSLDLWSKPLREKTFDRSRWIAGLGHGVTVKTPEENVRFCIEYFKELGAY